MNLQAALLYGANGEPFADYSQLRTSRPLGAAADIMMPVEFPDRVIRYGVDIVDVNDFNILDQVRQWLRIIKKVDNYDLFFMTGEFDRVTHELLMQFQEWASLPVTGDIDSTTYHGLYLAAQSAIEDGATIPESTTLMPLQPIPANQKPLVMGEELQPTLFQTVVNAIASGYPEGSVYVDDSMLPSGVVPGWMDYGADFVESIGSEINKSVNAVIGNNGGDPSWSSAVGAINGTAAPGSTGWSFGKKLAVGSVTFFAIYLLLSRK